MKGSKACISGCVCALTINHPNSRSPIDIDVPYAIERNSNNDDDDESIYPSRDLIAVSGAIPRIPGIPAEEK